MKSKKSLIIIAAFLVVMLGVAGFAYGKLSENADYQNNFTQETKEYEKPAEDTDTVHRVKADDFTVVDADGNSVNLSDFEGKPVIINFWASWCGYCQMEMPDFEEKYKEYGDEIHFLMVNVTDGDRETVETAKDYISQNGYTFPVYFDTELDASYTYGAYSLPVSFFIDEEGYGVAKATGMLDEELLQKGIDMIYTSAEQ